MRSASTAWTTAAGSCRSLAELAHVGSVASPLEPERIRRTFGELEALLRSRQRAGVRTMGAGPDGYGHVFLVIDNLYAFGRDSTDQFNTRNPLLAKVTELVNIGLAYGIHVVVTTPNWLEVPLAMRDGLGLRLELRLPDPRDSNVRVAGALRRPAESVPHDQPGRGLTMAAEHFLFAAAGTGPDRRDQCPLPGAYRTTGTAAAHRPRSRSRSHRFTGGPSGSSSVSAKRIWPRWCWTSPRTRC